MKIKVALLDGDQGYLNRIVTVFSTKYADKLEIYSFTNPEIALPAMETSRIDVLISSDMFDIDVSALPKRCGFAYFVNASDIDTFKDHRAICKFQKADLIYRQIVSIYSEVAGNITGLMHGDEDGRVIAFTSPSGGVGTSSMAAACAIYFAAKGEKTLYLNFEKYGSSNVFFSADGQFDMSDIIFALKSKKTNLSMKLESCAKQDARGVYFYSQSKLALDMMELNAEDIIRMISEAKMSGEYKNIILDVDFGMDKEHTKLLRQAHEIVWVGDGSEISNLKITRAYEALSIKEKNEDSPLTSRLSFIYNKFSNKTGKSLGNAEIKELGGAPRYEHATTQQVIEQLCKLTVFSKIK